MHVDYLQAIRSIFHDSCNLCYFVKLHSMVSNSKNSTIFGSRMQALSYLSSLSQKNYGVHKCQVMPPTSLDLRDNNTILEGVQRSKMWPGQT